MKTPTSFEGFPVNQEFNRAQEIEIEGNRIDLLKIYAEPSDDCVYL